MVDLLLSLVVPSKMERYRHTNLFLIALFMLVSVTLLVTPSVFRTDAFLKNHRIENNLTYYVYDSTYQVTSDQEIELPTFAILGDDTVDQTSIVYPKAEDNITIIREYQLTYLTSDQTQLNLTLVYELEKTKEEALEFDLATYLNTPKPESGQVDLLIVFTRDACYYIYNRGFEATDDQFYLYNSEYEEISNELFEKTETDDSVEYKYIGDNRIYSLFVTEDAQRLNFGLYQYSAATLVGINLGELSGNSAQVYNAFIKMILKEAAELVKFFYYLNAFFYTILFSFFFILATWLMSRKNGELTMFREYYAIAGVSFLVPSLVMGLVGIFIPYLFLPQYAMLAQMLFFIYCSLTINTKGGGVTPTPGSNQPIVKEVEVTPKKITEYNKVERNQSDSSIGEIE